MLHVVVLALTGVKTYLMLRWWSDYGPRLRQV